MKTHEVIQASLSLAAAGELAQEEQLLVEEHSRSCSHCAAELARLQQLISGLQHLPGPALPAYLVQRTVTRVEQQTTSRAERRSESFLMFVAAFIGWGSNLAAWLLSRAVFGGGFGSWWIFVGASMVLSWSAAGVAVVLLGRQHSAERRFYALASS